MVHGLKNKKEEKSWFGWIILVTAFAVAVGLAAEYYGENKPQNHRPKPDKFKQALAICENTREEFKDALHSCLAQIESRGNTFKGCLDVDKQGKMTFNENCEEKPHDETDEP